MSKQIYKKLSEYAKERGILYRTAWEHFRTGKIEGAFKSNTGQILIPIKDKPSSKLKVAALYARVSSNDRKKSLDKQLKTLESFAISNGFIISSSVKEVASGMNDNRKKLLKLLAKDDWNVLIVENKDRLTHFGFNYIESLLNQMGKEIIVVNASSEDKEDILKDLVSIIYSFSARLYGLRRRKKTEEIVEFLEK